MFLLWVQSMGKGIAPQPPAAAMAHVWWVEGELARVVSESINGPSGFMGGVPETPKRPSRKPAAACIPGNGVRSYSVKGDQERIAREKIVFLRIWPCSGKEIVLDEVEPRGAAVAREVRGALGKASQPVTR